MPTSWFPLIYALLAIMITFAMELFRGPTEKPETVLEILAMVGIQVFIFSVVALIIAKTFSISIYWKLLLSLVASAFVLGFYDVHGSKETFSFGMVFVAGFLHMFMSAPLILGISYSCFKLFPK